ncbi:hypothetical protein [Pelagibacterium luteolum]|uniref:Uncharacterized protein n=1 Tax=Pelagibacterium luteolum TaxID=440168 RepID=A0A1G7ZIW0_9HYPH|nr:hypothetical protein [Pelagibacterium luteolum]SDH08030.1 hypothetical protein SAMN04487974_12015 [Pelagibacterium luteolum]
MVSLQTNTETPKERKPFQVISNSAVDMMNEVAIDLTITTTLMLRVETLLEDAVPSKENLALAQRLIFESSRRVEALLKEAEFATDYLLAQDRVAQ